MSKRRLRRLEKVLRVKRHEPMLVLIEIVKSRDKDDFPNFTDPMDVIGVSCIYFQGEGPDVSAFFTDSGVEPTDRDLKAAYQGPQAGYEEWRAQQEEKWDRKHEADE